MTPIGQFNPAAPKQGGGTVNIGPGSGNLKIGPQEPTKIEQEQEKEILEEMNEILQKNPKAVSTRASTRNLRGMTGIGG